MKRVIIDLFKSLLITLGLVGIVLLVGFLTSRPEKVEIYPDGYITKTASVNYKPVAQPVKAYEIRYLNGIFYVYQEDNLIGTCPVDSLTINELIFNDFKSNE